MVNIPQLSILGILPSLTSSYTRILSHQRSKTRTAEKLGNTFTLLVYHEESGTGISYHVGMAALGIDSVATTYMNLTSALSLMGEILYLCMFLLRRKEEMIFVQENRIEYRFYDVTCESWLLSSDSLNGAHATSPSICFGILNRLFAGNSP